MSSGHPWCPRCGLPLGTPAAAELRHIDAQLASMAHHRAALLNRRSVLMAALRTQRAQRAQRAQHAQPPAAAWQPAPPTAPAPYGTSGGPWPHHPGQPAPYAKPAPPGAAAPYPKPAPDGDPAPTNSPTPYGKDGAPAQTVLLVLGGLLLTVAGLTFTLVSWGHMSIGGRATVLGAVTALAFAAHARLRRRLPATAETAAAVGLVLVLLDCYAARAAGLAGLDQVHAVTYAAWATALVGFATAAYGSWTASVLLPAAGLLTLQAAAPLVAVAAGGGAVRVASALALAAGFDVAAARTLPRLMARQDAPRAAAVARVAALVAAAPMAVAGTLIATAGALDADAYGPALRACGPLLIVTAVGVLAARLRELPFAARVFAAVVAGVSGVVALAGLPFSAASAATGAIAVAAPATALALAAGRQAIRRTAADRALWYGLGSAGTALLGLAVLATLEQLARALGEPLRRAWTHGGADRLGLGESWPAAPAAPIVLALLALVLAAAAQEFGRRAATGNARFAAADRELLLCAATVAGVVALAAGAPAAGLPYAAALAVVWAPALAAALRIVRRPQARPLAEVCALGTSAALSMLWSLPDDAATLTVWAATALLAAGLAAGAREPAPWWLEQGAAGGTVLVLGVVAARAGLAAGLPVRDAAAAVLAVAVLSVPAAALLPGVAVEFAGYGVTVAALLMTIAYPQQLSIAMAVAGCAAFGVALRPQRRPAGAVVGAVLLTGAAWMRLVLAAVVAPEPYVLPIAVIALVVGHVRRQRDAGLTSWAAYGVGLAVAFVPSVAAMLPDPHWSRPLLLGLAALAVTLYGAHHRLAAPLFLGGATLALVALHELGPALVQTLGALPRWVPLALGGLLLLFVGATYERRRGDARRLAGAVRRLS